MVVAARFAKSIAICWGFCTRFFRFVGMAVAYRYSRTWHQTIAAFVGLASVVDGILLLSTPRR